MANGFKAKVYKQFESCELPRPSPGKSGKPRQSSAEMQPKLLTEWADGMIIIAVLVI